MLSWLCLGVFPIISQTCSLTWRRTQSAELKRLSKLRRNGVSSQPFNQSAKQRRCLVPVALGAPKKGDRFNFGSLNRLIGRKINPSPFSKTGVRSKFSSNKEK